MFVGCADGGLRLIPVADGGHFDYNPRLWRDVNGKNSPCLTSLSVVPSSDTQPCKYLCATGGEDGSVSLFHLSYCDHTDES